MNGDLRMTPYDRGAAVRYAKRWAYGRNPAFYDYEKIGGGLHQLRLPMRLRRQRRDELHPGSGLVLH